MKESDKLNALRLIITPKIGPITYGLLIARYGGPTEAITQAPELARRQGRDLKITSKSAALKLIEKAEAQGACLLVKGAEDYPNRLSLFDDSPVILYAKGHLSLLQKDMVAVVGARNASLNAKQLAHHWSQAIGEAGYVMRAVLIERYISAHQPQGQSVCLGVVLMSFIHLRMKICIKRCLIAGL